MRKKSLLALACALALHGEARAALWGSWIAGGTSCNSNNVSVVNNGETLSVLFNEFGINMPEGDYGEGTAVRKTCNFRVSVTPPKGYYLASFRQVYSGGIIKSRGSSAQLSVRYNIGSVVGIPNPITFREGVAIRPEDMSSLFTRTFINDLAVISCGGSTVYGINMTFSGTRRDPYREFLVGGLDSVDADFVQEVMLIPEFRLCRR